MEHRVQNSCSYWDTKTVVAESPEQVLFDLPHGKPA